MLKAAKRNNGWVRRALILTSLWLTVSWRGLAVPMTAVQGPVYRADGSTAQGTLLVSWPAFTTSDGSAIAAGKMTTTIASDGSVSMALTPNAGASPQGTYYTVVYHLTDGTVSTEYWVVPQAAKATISQMRSKVVPAAVAQQTVSQQYVDSSISAIAGNYLQLGGGTMSGALNLSSDPASPLQAATKQYVDGSVGALGLGSAASHAFSDFDAAGAAAAAQNAAEAFALPIAGGTMGGPLTLYADPTQAMQAATKAYVDSHAAANLPSNAIPYQGSTGSTPVAATPTNIAAPFTSTAYSTQTYTGTLIGTNFNEGTAGTTIVGTKPATNVPNGTWVQTASAKAVFNAGGGATFGPANQGVGDPLIAVGSSSATYMLSNVVISGTHSWQFYFNMNGGSGVAPSKGLVLQWAGGGALSLTDYGNTTNTIATGSVGSTLSGNIVVTINGQSVSVNFFGTVMNGTIPAGSPTLSLSNFGMNPNGSLGPSNPDTVTVGSITITGTMTGLVSQTVACAGYLNSDGTCSTSGTNTTGAFDNNGHLAALSEKGTYTSNVAGQAPVTSIAWQDDFSAGVYDPRDPRWGAQDTAAHQAAALQTMANQMACDLTMGKVKQAVAKFPQGSFAVDNLLVPPGSYFIGTGQGEGGTNVYTFINNHSALVMPASMTVTCSDGKSHTDSGNFGLIEHFTANGCGGGGCTNAAGDTANYGGGAGPGNTGILMHSNGTLRYDFAQNFGGAGIIVDGTDAKSFHLRTYSNQTWYYYGGYKGVGETASSPEASTTTTGTTGSVALAWTAVPSANGYVIYRGTASGAENTVYFTQTNSFTDTCAAGASFTVTNIVSNSLATPGAITPTPSTTGGTCAAGTYYYKITAYTNDGWHGSVELIGTDMMASWIEAYGFQDAPTAYTYPHLADIKAGGGYGHFDHLWPQLGLVGIVDNFGGAGNNTFENIRVDFTRTFGVVITDNNDVINGGQVDGSCTTPNAATINVGAQANLGGDGYIAGTCTQIFSSQGLNINHVQVYDNAGYGATYKTADLLISGGTVSPDFNGTIQYITQEGMKGGYPAAGFWGASANVSGSATPTITKLGFLTPTDSSPITYTGFMYGQNGQNFYVAGGNANVTIQNNTYIKTCSGQNINLGSVQGYLHFIVAGNGSAGLYNQPIGVSEVCGTPAIVGSSETVTFSATPTFSTNTRASVITLAGNVTSFTLGAGVGGQEKTLTFCQNATGGFTVAAPANVHGFMTVGTTASKCSAQHFVYSVGQTAWLADSAGVTNE